MPRPICDSCGTEIRSDQVFTMRQRQEFVEGRVAQQRVYLHTPSADTSLQPFPAVKKNPSTGRFEPTGETVYYETGEAPQTTCLGKFDAEEQVRRQDALTAQAEWRKKKSL